jgi:lysophospholipase L1-like esterase
MIGTNNTRVHSPEQIAGGIQAIVEELKKQKSSMKVLVLGVFPRGTRADADPKTGTVPAAKLNRKVAAINAIIAGLDDGKTVFYKDIGKQFLDKDGGLSADVMKDYLHLTPKGYDVWGRAIRGDLEKLLK